ncbi:hypothetical protein A5719_09535 [Mycolicibacterium peregrinum]|uniref:toxin glutamine deamidase domain-containing protein n=1 Tax=Mycolicibacterium peregrinum TaxID=43304 RepID=UPI0007E93CDB|nr:toxin glutamine deamidase domain-containing protein [Mycolicibacterium peregrinum]OBF43318.1 hypothetical protein A5719_09535 [Mycolicibacterium peregrinum]
MSPAAAPDPLPTRSEIEEWDISYLEVAAAAWRQAATTSEDAFDQHRQNISSPGGTTWEGDAKDAVLNRVTADCAIVSRQGGVLREAADLAESSHRDIRTAQSEAVAAIKAAEDDDFSVGEDLSVTDTKRVELFSVRARQTSANEHAEDIRWYADRLVQADTHVGERLQSKAVELDGIIFDGEERNSPSSHVRFVDDTVQHDSKDEPGHMKPAVPGQAPGQIGPFAVPKSVEDATKKPEVKPPAAGKRTPGSLEDVLLPVGRAAAQPLSPAEIAEFKAQARTLLQGQGVPPGELESRVDAMLAETQRVKAALDDLPRYTPPVGPAPVKPSYSDGFGDAWRTMENSVHSLTGQNGFESFKDAWKGLGTGTLSTLSDPYGTVFRGIDAEIEAFRSNPEYWLGQKGFDAAVAATTVPFGGEVAAARILDDVVPSGVPHEVFHSPDVGHPAPSDGLAHDVPIGPWLPPSVDDIGQWLPDINHGPGMDPFDPARAINCGQCAFAVDQRLAGMTPDASAGLGTLSVPEMEAATGLRQVPATPSEIEQYLINQGTGAHTVVGVDRAGAAGHWFNAYYDGTKVYAVDGQTGQILGWPPNMDFPGHPVTRWDMGVQK